MMVHGAQEGGVRGMMPTGVTRERDKLAQSLPVSTQSEGVRSGWGEDPGLKGSSVGKGCHAWAPK